ncbi:response regulator [Actinoplanes sp. CA-030573]|uniref:response regulator n=1 Tax=Actinoplanes sp. CA-030573 TaxID=3239898 RepID=UPI003D8C9D31
MTRVLVVDDEPQIVRALRINLRARQYDVDTAPDGATALHAAARHHPDLVVLDLGLPDMEGTDVIRGLRGWTAVPIIVLSGRATSADKVAALDAGADDYVTKPFGVDELLARIRAVTRRAQPGDESRPVLTIGRHTIDLTARTVTGGDTDVRLTPREWELLEYMARHPGKLLSRASLLHDVWGPQYHSEGNYLRQYLARLRRKLETDPAHPQHLLTEPGMGYRLQP